MNAFWKNTAIPGYTTGFSNRRKKSPSTFWKSFARISQSVLYLTLNNIASKKDPHGSNQWPKSHHKTNEQPDPSTWKNTLGWSVSEDRHLWRSACFCFTAPVTHQSCAQIHHVYTGTVLTALLSLQLHRLIVPQQPRPPYLFVPGSLRCNCHPAPARWTPRWSCKQTQDTKDPLIVTFYS